MSNIYLYEPIIEQCNHTLLQVLQNFAQTGEDVRMIDLIARYAFDVLFATSTGKQPGFLSKSLDTARILEAMEGWKFHSIVYGSYMRFHPIIASVFGFINRRSSFQRQISQYVSAGIDKETCVAVVLAGFVYTLTPIPYAVTARSSIAMRCA